MGRPIGNGSVRLSRRELEIARLVAEGLTNREIASRLFISERTVDGHLEHVREKLGVNSRAQVAAWVTKQAEVPAFVEGVIPATPPKGRRRTLPRRWWLPLSAAALVLVEAVVVLQVVLAPSGPTITTIAGADPGVQGYPLGGSRGDGGLAVNAELSLPSSVAAAPGFIYIADYRNALVRVVDTKTKLIDTYIGGGTKTLAEGASPRSVALGFPTSVATDRQGRLYLLTNEGGTLEVWTVIEGAMHRVAALPPSGYEPSSYFPDPVGGLVVASDGTLYIADRAGSQVWQSTPTGEVSPLVGTGAYGHQGDKGPAATALLDSPVGLALDERRGFLYIADSGNDRIRRVNLQTRVIDNFAGAADTYGYGGDGGPATHALLGIPFGVAVGPNGTVFIADTENNRVRMVTPAGYIVALAGTGVSGFYGDGGPANSAEMSGPEAVTLDGNGNLLVADSINQRIREIVLVRT